MSKIKILSQPETTIKSYVGRELLLALHISVADFEPYIIEWKLNGVSVSADKVQDPDQALYIESMTVNDFGTYTARVKLVSNPQDYVDIKPITVNRRIGLTITDQSPTHIKKRLGEELDVFVTSQIEQGFTKEVIWYRNHVVLTNDKIQGNNVHVDRVAFEDFGVYTCKIIAKEDGEFVWSSPVVVEQETTPPTIKLVEDYQSEVTIPEDTELRLSVQATSNDPQTPIEYYWIHNDVKVIGEIANTLTIKHVTPAHAGTWRLEVRQGDTVVYSKDVKVSVRGQPFIRFTRQPLTLHLMRGASGQFLLDYATNYKDVKIQWHIKRPADQHFSPIDGATGKELWIVPATDAMNGNKYFAHLIYDGDKRLSTQEATLLVGNPIQITFAEQPKPLTNIRVGASARLVCKAISNYEHYKLDYQWYRGNDLLPNQNTNTLHFSSIAKVDEGQYKCVVSTGIQNHRIEATSNVVAVSVDDSAPTLTITKQPEPVKVRAGGVWALSIEATTNDAYPPRYKWFKDGVAIPQAIYNKHGEDHALIESSGTYTCRVRVGLGDHQVSKMSNPVQVVISDDIKVVPNNGAITVHPQDAVVPYNGKIVLHTESTNTIGVQPRYQWYKDNTPIEGATGETLIIDHAKPSDMGTYHAKVSVAEREMTTNPAVITMAQHQNVNIIDHPVDVVAKAGQKTDITLKADAEHSDGQSLVSYQWHKVKGNIDTPIQGATNKVYTIPHAQINPDEHEATYYAEVTDALGHKKRTEKVRVVFTTAQLREYVHPIPWRNTSFQYQGYWVMDEIERCNREGLDWLKDFAHTKYPREIETIAASLHVYSNTSVLESRNGYLIDGTRLF